MNATSRLSPMTSYYLRKFIEDRQDILHELLPEMHGAITLERLFMQMSRHGTADDQIPVIESLASLHKQLTKQASPDSTEVLNLDKRLFFSLGLNQHIYQPDQHDHSEQHHRSITVAGDCVQILNRLHKKALFFLGDTIGTKYLIETRPSERWCDRFKIHQRHNISYQGSLDEGLDLQQIRCFESWMQAFTERCAHIMSSFQGDIGNESPPDHDALLDW